MRRSTIFRTYLQRFNLALLAGKFLPPQRLRLGQGLDASLKLVDLAPATFKLSAHVVEFVRVLRLGILDALVEVELNLTELLQPRDEIIVEDAEVGEWFGLRGTVLLLRGKT